MIRFGYYMVFLAPLCALLCALYPVSPLNHYVQDVYVPMSGEDQEAYEKSLAIPGVVDKDRAKANARLEQAAKGVCHAHRGYDL